MFYLDTNATTPVEPKVLEPMMAFPASEWENLSGR
jgi:cysteine sulfinate desulfinase/cysteine desulfurase-like protein